MKKAVLVLLASLLASGTVFAAGEKTYEVTVTNITAGQVFTPIIAATHRSSIGFFELGQPASDELEMLAEGGNTLPLADLLNANASVVSDVVTTGGLLGPGESVTFYVEGKLRHDVLSLAAMLLPTHDTFVAVDSVPLPVRYSLTHAVAYDAGTEINDESCANIPGPYCMGAPYSAEDGEGFVHIANGIQGIGDLAPEMFDWRNPVAAVSIRRMK
ncbi:MAG: spondin domain-containing protein [Gammaproteobacteria bacterium]|nr:spondin domain-containing protein [Gammaproteobacteria bacterium]